MTRTPPNSVTLKADEPTAQGAWVAERQEKASAIAELIKLSFDRRAKTRVIGIFGPWGAGKTSLVRTAVHELPRHQELEFHPSFYEDETAVAVALFRSSLAQIQVAATGLKRLHIKLRLWWHNTRLRRGALSLARQLAYLAARVLILVVLPAAASLLLLPEALQNAVASIVALLGGSALVGERIKRAMEPGLNLNPDDFLKRVSTPSDTNALETYVEEFRWIATLARSTQNPLVVIVDPIDVGLPLQTAYILETLRLFDAAKAPCAFVILADDVSALRSAVRTRFLNQFHRDDVEGLTQDLIVMADGYFGRVLVPFHLSKPTADQLRQFWQNLLETSDDSPAEVSAG